MALLREQVEEDMHVHPLQRLDLVVRDWQSFTRNQTGAEKRQDMKLYMQKLLSAWSSTALAGTRERVCSCFDTIECLLLPHPGLAVTACEYDDSVAAINDRFLELLTAYFDDLFDPMRLAPKTIHGSIVAACDFLTYIKTYAALFLDTSVFPKAKTLLEATAQANNMNMKVKALAYHTTGINTAVGPDCAFTLGGAPSQFLSETHSAFQRWGSHGPPQPDYQGPWGSGGKVREEDDLVHGSQ